ncbi:GNAT family N-acetyltransferase [Brevibacillus reuszeri]|uniref:GNAT family N-acetyltransferase n=1 Tax=Brevibacillus reuszeri TaxID=54915 RepID=UPI000CCC71A6|nr:GNAT family N-acetyltransferase [Brevibacillus reuszeri]
MSIEQSLRTVVATTEQENFRFQVYASTRQEEVAAWGWEVTQQEAFLRMQFEMQQKSYQLQYPDANYQLIIVDEEPIGHMLLAHRDDKIILVDLALLPSSRGHGIGSRIIRQLQSQAEQLAKTIRLHVLITNEARYLYERLGFQAIGENGLHMEMEWKSERLSLLE